MVSVQDLGSSECQSMTSNTVVFLALPSLQLSLPSFQGTHGQPLCKMRANVYPRVEPTSTLWKATVFTAIPPTPPATGSLVWLARLGFLGVYPHPRLWPGAATLRGSVHHVPALGGRLPGTCQRQRSRTIHAPVSCDPVSGPRLPNTGCA